MQADRILKSPHGVHNLYSRQSAIGPAVGAGTEDYGAGGFHDPPDRCAPFKTFARRLRLPVSCHSCVGRPMSFSGWEADWRLCDNLRQKQPLSREFCKNDR